MSTIKRVQWTIQPRTAPRPWVTCNRCHAIKPFASSGKFRLNANGRQLDAWLIYRCADCESTWNRPIFERRHVKDIDPAALQSLQSNDMELVRSIAFDAQSLGHKSTRVEESVRCRCAEGNSDRRERAVVSIGNRAFGSNADLLTTGPPAIHGTPPVARLYLEAREGRASPRGARERSRTSKIDSGRDEDHDHPARSRRRFGARAHRLPFSMIEQDKQATYPSLRAKRSNPDLGCASAAQSGLLRCRSQ